MLRYNTVDYIKKHINDAETFLFALCVYRY